jgi:hypothetical protein
MDVQLTVETAKHGNDPVVWEMSYGTLKGGPKNYPTVTVPDKGQANFTITIKDPGNVTFSNDPIWIQKDDKPTKSGVHGIKDVSGGGTTVLTFKDGNANKEKLVYALNFANVPAGTPAQLDPIIDNQGGGPGGMMAYRSNSTLLIGGAVLLLLVLALVLLRRRSAMSPRPTDLNES